MLTMDDRKGHFQLAVNKTDRNSEFGHSHDSQSRLESSPKPDFAKYRATNFEMGYSHRPSTNFSKNNEYMDSLQQKLRVSDCQF